MLTDQQYKYISELIGDTHSISCTTPQDFFDVVRVMEEIDIQKTLSMLEGYYPFPVLRCKFSHMIKQPTFIEKFMKAVCEVKGVK
jgi:hypothetical protein